MEVSASKVEIREKIWTEMERRGVARPPKPIRGRIPNFLGAERAAKRLFLTSEWSGASVIKANPDSPQRPVRLKALVDGKTLIMPTPRLREGFLILTPSTIPPSLYQVASTIRGAFRLGKRASLRELRRVGRVDLIVEGSVAVSAADGSRLGKGEGYGELEYAILRELGLVSEDVPIATTVHEIQVLSDPLPQDPWDVPVDLIATPEQLVKVEKRGDRPEGIIWNLLPDRKLREMPVLKELKLIKTKS